MNTALNRQLPSKTRILPDSELPGHKALFDSDAMTSVIPHGGKLLALWEGRLELAAIPLEHHVPDGFHGGFYRAAFV